MRIKKVPPSLGAMTSGVAVAVAGSTHEEMDAYGKANNLTVVYADWHPSPQYRLFRTGSLLSRNEEYPSGLVIVDETGKANPWRKG